MIKEKKYIGPRVKKRANDWEITPLQECIKGTGQYGINKPAIDFNPNLPRYLRITDIDDNGFLKFDNLKSVETDKYGNYLLKEGDIVFARTGNTVGKSYLYKKGDGLLVFAGYLIRFRPKPEILRPKYLKYYTESNIYWNWVNVISQRSGQPGVNSSEYKKLPILLPPLIEQDKIVQILSTWDQAITTLEKLINAKKQCKKALMQQLLTGKKRFPEFEGEPWREVKLYEIANVISSNLDKKIKKDQEKVELCNYMDVYDNSVIDSSISFMKSTASKFEIKKYVLKNDDVIITKDSETPDDIASAAFIDNLKKRVLCGYHLAIIRPKKGKVIGNFLAKQMMEFSYRKQFFRIANGATRFGLRIADIEKSKFFIPSLNEQKYISSFLNNINREIILLNKLQSIFALQKKGLMQQLLTGKIRVT